MSDNPIPLTVADALDILGNHMPETEVVLIITRPPIADPADLLRLPINISFGVK